MGGVAGASGGRRLTRWRFALDDVVAGEPVALLLAPAEVARVVPVGGGGRSVARHGALAALAGRVLGGSPRLLAGPDGIRRLDGTRWFASVAERDGWVAAALAPFAVGVDVESVAEAARAEDAVLTGVVTVEPAAWHGLAGVWAAREAVLKAGGRDLTRDPGGWRFAPPLISMAGGREHRVDLVARGGVVAALAYAGS